MKHILVTTDLSPESEPAAAVAAALAALYDGCQISLVYVTEMASDLEAHAPATPTLSAYHKQVRALAQSRLEEQRRKLFGDLPGVRSEVLDGRSVWRTLCDYAEKKGVDMITIATHGRTGFRQAMIGSVAERVVRAAPCPVLTVPSAPGAPKAD